VLVQYLAWMGDAARGDFGRSYTQSRPVWAIPLGVVSAVRQNGWMDYLARLVSMSGPSLGRRSAEPTYISAPITRLRA
jgi:ABC-type dipeptide/oligopeptide/nickel transport system permease component